MMDTSWRARECRGQRRKVLHVQPFLSPTLPSSTSWKLGPSWRQACLTSVGTYIRPQVDGLVIIWQGAMYSIKEMFWRKCRNKQVTDNARNRFQKCWVYLSEETVYPMSFQVKHNRVYALEGYFPWQSAWTQCAFETQQSVRRAHGSMHDC